MLSKYNVSIDTMLHIPSAVRHLVLFLEREFAAENIHYVLAVNEFTAINRRDGKWPTLFITILWPRTATK